MSVRFLIVQHVRHSAEYIKTTAETDPRLATVQEYELWASVLRAISKGLPDAQELAAEALATYEMDFPREQP